MPQVMLNLTLEEIRDLILQLPAQDLQKLLNAIEDQVETAAMMHVAETGFQEWHEEGEDIYDAES